MASWHDEFEKAKRDSLAKADVAEYVHKGRRSNSNPNPALLPNAKTLPTASPSMFNVKRALKLFVICIPLIFVVAWLQSGTSSRPFVPSGPSESDAFYMAQQFVTKNLKAPATADFAWKSDSQIEKLSDTRFRVHSYVDAQNIFGAKLRNRYVCELESTGGDYWKLIDLQIANP